MKFKGLIIGLLVACFSVPAFAQDKGVQRTTFEELVKNGKTTFSTFTVPVFAGTEAQKYDLNYDYEKKLIEELASNGITLSNEELVKLHNAFTHVTATTPDKDTRVDTIPSYPMQQYEDSLFNDAGSKSK